MSVGVFAGGAVTVLQNIEGANKFFDDFEASPLAAGTTLLRFPPDAMHRTSVMFITRDQVKSAAK